MPRWKNSTLLDKTLYSIDGLRMAFKTEKAVRNEVAALIFAVLLALFRGASASTVFCVFISCLLPIIAELINTAAETIIDLLAGSAYREDVKMAKDMLSASVFLSLCIGYGLSLKMIFF